LIPVLRGQMIGVIIVHRRRHRCPPYINSATWSGPRTTFRAASSSLFPWSSRAFYDHM